MSANDSIWTSYVSAGLQAYQRGEYEQAQNCLEKNLVALNDDLEHVDSVKADLLSVLANVHRERDDYDRADLLYRQAIEIKEDGMNPNKSGLLRLYRDFAMSLIMQDNFSEALSIERLALKLAEANASVHRFDIQRSLSRLAAIAHADSNYRAAYHYYLAIISERDNLQKGDSARPLYADFGTVCYRLRKYDEAEHYWSLALSLGNTEDDEANALRNDLGLALCAQHKHGQAQGFCRRSAELRHSESTTDKISNIADVYCQKDDFVQARPLCETASELRGMADNAATQSLAIKLELYCRYVRRLFCCEKTEVIERRIRRLSS